MPCASEHIYKCTARFHYSALFWAYKFKYMAYGTLCGLFASRFLSLFIASTFPFYQYKIVSSETLFYIIDSNENCTATPLLSRQQPAATATTMSLLWGLNAWPMADWCMKCIYLNLRNLKLFHTLKTLNELWIHCRCRRQWVLCVYSKRTKHFKTVIVV